MHRKLPAALVSALLCAGMLATPVAADPPVDDCGPTELGCGVDLDWADALEDAIADNIWDGQVYEIEYGINRQGRPLPRTRQHVADVHAYGDSALWTGTYLGSQSFRYALAKHKLEKGGLSGGQIHDWEVARDEAKARIDDMVRKFHILVNISKHWKHKFNVSHQQAGFGGGVFNGEPGYLMRACIDKKAPEWQRWDDKELARPKTGPESMEPYTGKPRVFGPFPWKDEKTGKVTNYLCEDGTSRDAYAGTIFGLLLAFDLVSSDDGAMRTQIRNDIVTLSNFAYKYLWNTPRPHGRIRLPLDEAGFPSCDQVNAVIKTCGHDFENFISPLFVITPWARMEMTQAAHHVTAKHAGHDDAAKWQAIFVAELAEMTPFLAFSHMFDTAAPYDSYYKWNLEHLIAFNLVRQAPNEAARAVYKQGISVMDATTHDDINAHFEAITYGLTGEQSRLDESLDYLREWQKYRERIETGVPTNNLARCAPNGDLDCVPEDQRDLEATPGAPRVPIFPGTPGADLRAHEPLPVEARPPTDFLWQRPPNQLNGSASAQHQAPGIDYLLPYWMLRFLTEGAGEPVAGSFPVWPGPSYH